MKSMSNIQSGHAAEMLVQFRLMTLGIATVQADPTQKFDVVAFAPDPIKIQVKSSKTFKARSTKLCFSVHNGGRNIAYNRGEFDVLALVNMIDERILFMPWSDKKVYKIDQSNFTKKSEIDSICKMISNLDKN